MQALNVHAEHVKSIHTMGVQDPESIVTESMDQGHADVMVRNGLWVEDDGDYYTREEWDQEQADVELEDRWNADDNFRSWLDDTEPE